MTQDQRATIRRDLAPLFESFSDAWGRNDADSAEHARALRAAIRLRAFQLGYVSTPEPPA